MALLSITGASKSYGGTPALRAAALELRAGEVHALMGENGAGKSTLIKILAGVVAADEGEIGLRGRPIAVNGPADAFAHGLRFIHQELNVVSGLSVAENIFLGRPYPRRLGAFVDWAAMRRAAAVTLGRLGIVHIDPGLKVARLGTGDRMLVTIAGALVDEAGAEASVYVMDEPTAALSGAESARLFDAVRRLKARGCGVLYVSHRLDEVFGICDRVTVMRDGRSLATLEVGSTTRRDVIRLMTGREMTHVYPPRERPVGDALVLEVEGLASRTLRDVDLSVREGEILGVAGLAGSGQSELLGTLMGAEPRRAGRVRVDGRRQGGRLGPASAWSRGLAFVPQERRSQGLILSRSVRDNVTLPHLARLSHSGVVLNTAREERATRALSDRVGLRARGPRQRSDQLSGGNQQKVVFARALAGEPRVLLLDEPTRGVDVAAKYDIHALIRTLSARGSAVLLASSDLAELVGMCDRILVMRAGRAVGVVDAVGLTPEALLGLCYGDRDGGPQARGQPGARP